VARIGRRTGWGLLHRPHRDVRLPQLRTLPSHDCCTHDERSGSRIHTEGWHIHNYLGLRFAADPGGAHRWRAPRAPQPWLDVQHSTVWPRTCPQNPGNWHVKPFAPPLNGTNAPDIGLSSTEDCLKLNVVRPPPAQWPGPRPVLVWFPGGGFVAGDSWNHGQYDAGTNSSTLVRDQGVIVVSVNYRLSVLGFMSHPALMQESGTQGKWGMLDQVAGLRWVKQNIRKFGGDPERVTIAGESAGGISVCWHLAAPVSKGLFSSAIMESGFCDYRGLIQTPELMYPFYQQRGVHLGCGNHTGSGAQGAEYLECMRALDWRNIIMNNPNMTFPIPAPCFTFEREGECLSQDGHRCKWVLTNGTRTRTGRSGGRCRGNHPPPAPALPPLPPPTPAPVAPPKTQQFPLKYPPMKGFLAMGPTVDGTVLPGLPQALIAAGRWNKVPLIIGHNHDEGNFFILNVKSIVPGTVLPISRNQTLTVLNHFLGERLAREVAVVYHEPGAAAAAAEPGEPSRDRGGDGSRQQAAFEWETGRLSTILTDYFFRCRTRRTARAVAQQGVPVYAYEFVYKTNHWLDGLLLRDYHMSELPFVWQNWALTEAGAPVAQIPWPQFRFPRWVVTDKDHTMGRTFAKYWTNMARANSPNHGNVTRYQPPWPAFQTAAGGQGAERVLIMDVPPRVETDAMQQRARCDWWDYVEVQMERAYRAPGA
jgi:carboxylesterase type B